MFNTKRIKALEKELQNRIEFFKKAGLQLMEDSLGMLIRIQALERKQVENYIPCSTCKCLIRKEDAIRGKSEVRLKREVGEVFNTYTNSSKIVTVEQEETIYTPYYCHNKDCKPKK